MTVIDVHTHMLNWEWVDILKKAESRYEFKTDPNHYRFPDAERLHVVGVPHGFHTLLPDKFDWELRIAKMDESGVDIAVVSLTAPQANFGPPELSLEAARVSNDDMMRQQEKYPDRIRYLAAIPWMYPELAIKELARACDNGAVGVFTCANIDGESPVDPKFAPIWEEIDRRALPVLVHPTVPPGVEVIAKNGLHAGVGFHFDTTHALERMINTGFLDRYTKLKIIGSHAGGFLPWIIGRLDDQPVSKRLPSDYVDRFFVDSMAWSPETLDLTLSIFGPDQILFGSDYPYGTGNGMTKFLGMVDALPNETADKIRSSNAQRIFEL